MLPGMACAYSPGSIFSLKGVENYIMNVSYWNDIFDTKERPGRETLSIGTFMDGIQRGRWKPEIERVRGETGKEKRKVLKNALPQITPSGIFADRKETGLLQHSGYLLLDFDNVPNVTKKREEISCDKYVAGTFVSAGGNGIAVFIRIEPDKHEAAFEGLEKYFWDKYGLVADVARKHVAATRAVSYDPDSTYNSMAVIWDKYLPAKKQPKRYVTVPCTKSDIGRIVAQMNCDITDGSYEQWVRLGASFASMGETGREFFHACSSYNAKYDQKQCDKKFDNLLDTANGSITIGTFYHMAEQAGLSINREKPRAITRICKEAKRQRKEAADAIERLVKVNAIVADDVEDIALVKEVFEETEAGISDGIQEIEEMVRELYPTRLNMLSGKLEYVGKSGIIEVKDRDMVNVYIEVKKSIPTVRRQDVFDIIETKCETYHPVKDFIEKHRGIGTDLEAGGYIQLLSDTLIPAVDGFGAYGKDYILSFVTKWMVGMIAGIYGNANPILLALLGAPNVGKSYWFRHLLPKELLPLFAEPVLRNDKDSEMYLCTYLLLLDDELSNKNRLSQEHLKNMLTKEKFTFRYAYARKSESHTRVATLCGTGNELEVLSDFSGNRRIVPIHVHDINKELYNEIDKTALFMDAVRLYESGIRWQLTKEDIILLKNNTEKHEVTDNTGLTLLRYYRKPRGGDIPIHLTPTDILLETNEHHRIGNVKWWTSLTIGRALRRHGFSFRRTAGGMKYLVVRKSKFEREAEEINGDTY